MLVFDLTDLSGTNNITFRQVEIWMLLQYDIRFFFSNSGK